MYVRLDSSSHTSKGFWRKQQQSSIRNPIFLPLDAVIARGWVKVIVFNFVSIPWLTYQLLYWFCFYFVASRVRDLKRSAKFIVIQPSWQSIHSCWHQRFTDCPIFLLIFFKNRGRLDQCFLIHWEVFFKQ